MPALSLAHIGFFDLTPPELVVCAAAAGFDAVNFTLNPSRPGAPQFPIRGDTAMAREARAALADTGLILSDVTSIPLRPESDPAAHEPLFAAAQFLGARSFVAVGQDPDHARLTDTYARLCEIAAPYGLTIDLEFMLYSQVRTIEEGLAIVRGSGQPNARLLIDCLHFSRAGSDPALIGQAERGLLAQMQLCDAPVASPEDLPGEARGGRLPPGMGGLDLAAIMAQLPRDLDVSVEVPMGGELAALPALERATLLHDASRGFLRSVGWGQ